MDTLNNPKEDWQKQKNEWAKYLKGNSCYKTKDLANKNLIPVSAFLYTLLEEYRNNEFTKDDDKYFYQLEPITRKFRIRDINEGYNELKDFTNIEFLKDKLQREVISQYKQKMINDIKSSYTLCSNELKQSLTAIKNEQMEIIQTSTQGIDEIKRKKAEYIAKMSKASDEKKEINDLIKQLRVQTTKRVSELTKTIKDLNKR